MTLRHAIGIDIGGTNIRAAIIDSDGNVAFKLKEATGDTPVETLHNILNILLSQRSWDVCGIGIAIAGLIDTSKGVVMRSPNIPKLTGINIKSEVEKSYKGLVLTENDANAAAFGERFTGAGKNLENFVLITLGTGIGGGIITGNNLLHVAAEIGHMSINANGKPCACGNVGCLESYASATAVIGNVISEIENETDSILKDLYNGNFYKITAEDIYKTALEGDPLARSVLREAGRNLGIGIANVVNILSPDAVILAGGLTGAWHIYVDAAIKEASKRALKELYNKVNIMPSSLGDDAGIIGAAKLVFEECE
ncbi:MAG: ROK family protein [Thermodesulfovibrionales bacterium]|nr:ROK family protein [Thermodesulfovibrionales bacterium]